MITVADFGGAKEHGVHFSNGYADGNAFHALTTIGELTETGRFWLPVDKTFPLAAVVEARQTLLSDRSQRPCKAGSRMRLVLRR